MKNFKFFIIFLAMSLGSTNFAVAKSFEQRRSALIETVNEELKEIIRLNKRAKGRKPSLYLRMAELLLEKARLLKEQENASYVTSSPEQRLKINKAKHFRNSSNYFKQAQKTGYEILRRFKNFKYTGDVYYILAYNAKEFQDYKKAEKFFAQAVKYRTSSPETQARSRLALAEIYFNRNEFRRAIPFYEKALASNKDKWYTKDLYNYSWCYFRIGKSAKAISLMKESYRLSKKPQYIDMRYLVERDLAYFYTESGQTKEAINFYKKTGKGISGNLIKVGKYLQSQGKYTLAEKSFTEALKHSLKDREKIDVHLKLLSLYEKSGNTKSHLKSSEALHSFYKQGQLNSDDVDVLTYHVERKGAMLQKQVASKRYKTQRKVRNRKARYAQSYFTILGAIRKKDAHRSMFLAAEAMYASKKFNKSLALYEKCYLYSKKINLKKYMKLSQEGMIASLAGKGVTKKTKEKYTQRVYQAYLVDHPRDKRSFSIYQRLFNQQMEQKNVSAAENTLMLFKRNFPSSKVKQEAMLAKIMDHHKKTGNKASMVRWAKRINSGQFSVSKKFAKRLRLLLLAMQFENVEKFNSTGEKKKALKGYVEIYKEKSSSPEAKKNAAYNIAILFYDLGDAKRTHLWSKRSLEIMNSNDINKFSDSFLSMASDLFHQRELVKSSEIYSLTLNKICHKKSKVKDILYKNGIILELAQENLEKARKLIYEGKKCKISQRYIRNAKIDLLKAYGESESWGKFKSYIGELEKDRSMWPYMIYPVYRLQKILRRHARNDSAKKLNKKIMKFFNKSNKREIPLEGLDVVARLKLSMLSKYSSRLQREKLSFPEKKFNGQLKKKFAALDKLTASALDVLKIGSGLGIVKGYKFLVENYEYLVREIRTFAPKGKSQEYTISFQKSMRGLTTPILNKSNEFRLEAVRQIRESKILSNSNYFFNAKSNAPDILEYFSLRNGVLMDRGGGQ